MPQRTSAYEVLARYWVLAFILSLPFGLPAVLAGVLTLPFLAFVALVVTFFFNGFQWIAHRLVFSALFGDDEEYQRFRENGGDPWFHLSCPPPFNTDSDQLRITGNATRWFCRNCGADMPDPHAPCPVCEFGRWACGRCGALVTDQFARCSECGNHPKRKRGPP